MYNKYLQENNFEKYFAKLINKLKGKKILIYGAGQIFKFIKKNYDLSELNVVGICDSGANADCDPFYLQQFAIMGSIYMEKGMNVSNPKVALLNIGTEEEKGDMLRKEAYQLIKQIPNINFVGNMEARDFLSGNYDIVVADGFYGNILLKSVEGTVGFVTDMLKKEIKSGFWSKIGSLFMKKTFKNLKANLNYNNYGGAAFLGVKKLVVKGHGASDTLAYLRSIEQVRTLHNKEYSKIIEEELNKIGEV